MAIPLKKHQVFAQIDPATGQFTRDPVTNRFLAYISPEDFPADLIPLNFSAMGWNTQTFSKTSEFSQECGLTPPPVVTGAPVMKALSPPPFYTYRPNYSWSFTLDDIATPATGTTLTGVALDPNKPSYLTLLTNTSASGTSYTLTGSIPVGTKAIPLTLIVSASNGKSVAGNVTLQPGMLSPLYGYAQKDGSTVVIRVGPAKIFTDELNPFITQTGPAGYAAPGRVLMETWVTDPAPVVNNQKTYFQKPYSALPPGTYNDSIEFQGQTWYTSYSVGAVNFTTPLSFSLTPPDAPVVPTPEPAEIIWPAYATVYRNAGEVFSLIVPGAGFVSETPLKSMEFVGNVPEGAVLFLNPSNLYQVTYTIPSNHPGGTFSVGLKATTQNGQTKTNTLPLVIAKVEIAAMVMRAGPSTYFVLVGPTKLASAAQPRVRVIQAPSGWNGSLAYRTLEDHNYNAYAYRVPEPFYDFNNSNQFVLQIEHNGLIRYAVFNGNLALYQQLPLTLTATEPTAPVGNVTYFVQVPATGINEGSNGYLRPFVKAGTQDAVPFSGGKLKSSNLRAGTTLSEDGFAQVAYNDTYSDTYTQDFYLEVNGQNVYNGSFVVNDTTSSSDIPIDLVDHSGESTTGYYTSQYGLITELGLTVPTSLNEGTGNAVSAGATSESGYVETDLSKMKIYLATLTGEFVLATAQTAAVVAGVTLTAIGTISAATNTTTGDGRSVRVKVEYGGKEAIKTINILDTTTSALSVLAVDWAFTRNNPPSVQTLTYFYVKTNLTGSTMQLALQGLGPGGYEFPKSTYSDMTVGDFGSGYQYRADWGALTPGLLARIFIRKAGSTTDLFSATVQLPLTGNVPRTTILAN